MPKFKTDSEVIQQTRLLGMKQESNKQFQPWLVSYLSVLVSPSRQTLDFLFQPNE